MLPVTQLYPPIVMLGITACLQGAPADCGIQGLVPVLIATWVQAIIATGKNVKNVKEGLQEILDSTGFTVLELKKEHLAEVLKALGLNQYSKLVGIVGACTVVRTTS